MSAYILKVTLKRLFPGQLILILMVIHFKILYIYISTLQHSKRSISNHVKGVQETVISSTANDYSVFDMNRN